MKISESSARRGMVRFRGKELLRTAACWMLIAQLAGVSGARAAADKSTPTRSAASTAGDPVLKAMQNEITRATAELGKAEQPPYYLSYTVYDQDFVVLVGAYGSLLTDTVAQRRFADVNMRVGLPELDNTHGQSRPSGVNSGSLPLGNDQDAIARVLWELTDREYKRAVPSLLNVRTKNHRISRRRSHRRTSVRCSRLRHSTARHGKAKSKDFPGCSGNTRKCTSRRS